QRVIRFRLGRESDRSAAVAYGVVGKVSERTPDERLVRAQRQSVRDLNLDDSAAVLVELPTCAYGSSTKELGGRHLRGVGGRAAGRSGSEQRVGEGSNLGGVVREPAKGCLVLVGRPRFAQRDVDLGGERAERCAQLVTGVVDELLLPQGRSLELAEHR